MSMEPEPEPEADVWAALGMGPDLYDYRAPYGAAAEALLAEQRSGGGGGFPGESELQSAALEGRYRAAAAAIARADFLLVGLGAGMGVDSGLATYADVAAVRAWAARGHDYGSLCRPELLREDPALFYGFWGHCYNRYADATPHAGYGILRRWCTELLPARQSPAREQGDGEAESEQQGDGEGSAGNHWIYSSNVDGHALRAGLEASAVLELHGGCAGSRGWFCSACTAAAKDGDARAAAGCCPPEGYRFAVDPETMTLPDTADGAAAAPRPGFGGVFGQGWPRCGACGGLLRPAVHMFGEDDAALLAALQREEGRYVAWECAMEKAVVGEGARLVLLEIGCGLRVPSVRLEMECVLRDLAAALGVAEGGGGVEGRVTLVRVNPEFPQSPGWEACSVSIRASAEPALRGIDAALGALPRDAARKHRDAARKHSEGSAHAS